MERNIENKVVVVTGAAQGIGYEIALHFLKQKAKNVVVLDINEVEGNKSVNNLNSKYGGGRAKFIKCDVTKDLDEVSKKILETYKQVDILVNNAGSVNERSARKTLELNAISLMEWTMKFWEHMRKDKGGNGGTIINIASIYSYKVDPYLVFYKASKFAVRGFTRCLGHELNYKKFGVRLIVVCPGFTDTALNETLLCWDEHMIDYPEFTKTQPWQSCEVVGEETVNIFKNADSGSAWSIIGGEVANLDDIV